MTLVMVDVDRWVPITDEYESRRIPGEDHVRRIDPRSIRPPGPAT
jgi:hypothetical protein